MYYINVKTKTINEWTKKKRKNNEQKQRRKVSSKQNKQIRFTSTQTNKVYVNPSALSKRTIIIKGIYGYPLTRRSQQNCYIFLLFKKLYQNKNISGKQVTRKITTAAKHINYSTIILSVSISLQTFFFAKKFLFHLYILWCSLLRKY